MTDYQKCVSQFMTVAGQHINEEFSLAKLEYSIINFRISLIQEEYNELIEGIKNKDSVEIIDALADLLYVIYGTASTFGVTLPKTPLYNNNLDTVETYIKDFYLHLLKLKSYKTLAIDEKSLINILQKMVENVLLISYDINVNINEVFMEVHSSNMSKFCTTLKDIKKSVEEYDKKEGADFVYYKKIGDYYVLLRKSDDKVLKGINYFKPSISKFLKNG